MDRCSDAANAAGDLLCGRRVNQVDLVGMVRNGWEVIVCSSDSEQQGGVP